MSIYRHIPAPPLNQYVDFCWYYVDLSPDHDREHVLPDGTFELIVNLQEIPRKLFHGVNSATYAAFERGWISGAHSKFLVIDALPRSSVIGVHFKPGGAAAFLGVPAGELADRHLSLDDVWGTRARDLRDRLVAAESETARFTLLEQALLARVRRPLLPHSAVVHALARLA